MNNLYALSLEESAKTSEGIAKISELLRSVLYDCNDVEIELDKEIKLIENYIELEKMRYGKGLKVSFDVKGETKNKTIAPMLFFTFVENCFKHGCSNDRSNPFINVIISVSEKKIQFYAGNSKNGNKNGNDKKNEGGIGLKNVQKRLEIIYGDNYDLKITDIQNKFEVSLSITK